MSYRAVSGLRYLSMDILERLLEYDCWITRRTLEHCHQFTETQLHQRFDIGWETVDATLVHIVTNMELWCELLHGRSPRATGPRGQAPSLGELLERHEAVARELGVFARTRAMQGNLDGIMVDPLYDPPVDSTYGTVLCDIFHENIVHRSEVRHMLQRLNAPPIEAYDPMSWEWEMEKQNPQRGLRNIR